MPLDAPSWSPDGNLIAFEGVLGKLLGPAGRSRIFVAAPDGSGIRDVPGTRGGRDPIFAPDGHTIAFSRERHAAPPRAAGRVGANASRPFQSTAVWLVDLETGTSRQLTPWRNGLGNVPTSFSPDGSVLAVARQSGENANPEVVALRVDGSGSTVLARNGTDGVYSPDGSRIALVRVHQRKFGHRSHGGTGTAGIETTTDLFVMKADGSDSRRLTSTPKDFEIWPSWDPSGERLAYARFRGGSEAGMLGFGDAIMEINADGSCTKKVLSARLAAFYGPAWQPGVNRAAGRINCA
jgi:TolB protein